MYHKVSEQYEWGVTTTTPRQFRAQMLALKHLGFSFSRTMDFDPSLHQILITFDDGYSCIKEYAAPVLDEVGGVATVFAITDYVGKKILGIISLRINRLTTCPGQILENCMIEVGRSALMVERTDD